jgi:conjugal transfer mating pair stabilization protein TraG
MNTLANSSSINANYNQQFVDWLANQPADHTTGHIGQRGAADIIANDPQLAVSYVNKYMGEQGLLPKADIQSSPNQIWGSYANETAHQKYMATQDSVNEVNRQGATELPQVVQDKGIEVRDKLDKVLSDNTGSINHQSESINDKGGVIKKTVEDEKNRYVTVRLAEKLKNEGMGLYEDAENLRKDLLAQKKD